MDKYSYISNAHGAYIDELYSSYQQDPNSVDPTWRQFFEGFDFSLQRYGQNGAAPTSGATDGNALKKEIAARELIDAYRTRGHLESKTNPVRTRKDRQAMLDLHHFGLTEADLDTVFQAGEELFGKPETLRSIVDTVKRIYTGSIGYEFMSIRETDILNWFKERVEKHQELHKFLGLDEKKYVLSRLNDAAVFEDFLHKKYVGQKRFSLEGGDATIPALSTIINVGAKFGLKEVYIGMAHRGRLNVLAHIMGKPYGQIFTEFDGEARMDEQLGDGDVKYHMGYTSEISASNGEKVTMVLMPNPSHLEAVNPVVVGSVKAKLDMYYNNDYSKIIPIVIHGDAAVAGQGIVYEMVQMSNLRAYNVGGTIHFTINNQVGFTTDFTDARSSIYCSDLSGLVEAPELHVNGDDPEAVVFVSKLAVEFRQRYHRDVFIDMVCYRRHGHNESDEPRFTQPLLYEAISKHKNPRDIYAEELVRRGDIAPDFVQQLDKALRDKLTIELDRIRQQPLPYKRQQSDKAWRKLRKAKSEDFLRSPDTSISEGMINKIAQALTTIPDGFTPLKQIEKLLSNRKERFFEKKQLGWPEAELLAYGSILLENRMVRMTGQDVERGTFTHRHAVLADALTNDKYYSLDHIDPKNQAKHHIYNSLLSEYGVLGFEYGYAASNPHALTIWEAQFGDFANGAQIIIDQFISSSESKWFRMSGLVMLLPHGYEGQGPEHSNARPERYLQLCAQDNMVVCNVTTAANLFHMLRRQITWPFRKPLIVFTPKSLLRDDRVMSPMAEFTNGRFQEVIGDEYAKPQNKVEKVLLCSGKIYYDLLEYQQANQIKNVAVIRIEQLHPFPEAQLEDMLSKYKKLSKVIWVQEEPVNMGYWTFIMRSYYKRPIELVARKPSASPATGYLKVHKREQERIVEAAFKR